MDRLGKKRHVDGRGGRAGGAEGDVAEVDLGELEHGGDFFQHENRDVRPFLERGEMPAADSGKAGEAGLGEAFLDASGANRLTEHSK